MLDGDVDESTAKMLFTRLKHDAAFRKEWEAWCLVGDVIRDGAQPEMEGFTERVMFMLEDEPTVLAPPHRRDRADVSSATAERSGFLRRRLLPVAASVMGVLAVAGVVSSLSGSSNEPPLVAQREAATTVTSPQQVVVAAPALPNARVGARPDYLFAHQALSGGPVPAAMQYMRTVSSPADE